MKKNIPNLLTLLNLASGAIAILLATQSHTDYAALFLLLAAVFDFLDGFAARILHVKSEVGKELDSLSDMVSFGLAPAMIGVFHLQSIDNQLFTFSWQNIFFFAFILLYPCCAALRLAKFNLDTRQSEHFLGLPTPAAAFVLMTLQFFPVIDCISWIYIIVSLFLCILMLIEIPLISLKFKNFYFKENIFRYILILCAAILLIFFHLKAVPFIIALYILLSVLQRKMF
ncbi:MAG: CDP-diacylglycerol--serine O-phosphatidyltransferase [Bacteroidales bacterium]|jgi:CDP-diacylglycerol--serine O-phosphatidyltransferase|nr:CDP-diacylglycerol--serine O-phosphatidyltransferase [Bacteroidales bacterium]